MVYNRIKKNKSHFIFTSQLQTFNNNSNKEIRG